MKTLRLVIVGGVLWSASSAQATVLVPADLPELVAEAAAVVRGRVVMTEARRLEGQRTIETVVTIQAQEYLKGDLGPTVTIRVPGGQIGTQRSVLIGAPAFKPGDDVVLFLGARPPAVPWILGLNQGVYRVRTAQPARVTGSEAEPFEVVRPARHRRSTETADGIPLGAFMSRVRALARSEGAQ